METFELLPGTITGINYWYDYWRKISNHNDSKEKYRVKNKEEFQATMRSYPLSNF